MSVHRAGIRNAIDLQPVIDATLETLERAKTGPGRYLRRPDRTPGNPPSGPDPDPYGCAGAANLLYSIGAFPGDPGERACWTRTLQGMQNPQTGLFYEAATGGFVSVAAGLNDWKAFSGAGIHHPFHATAHCIAALELFDAKPLHKTRGLDFLAPEGSLETFLDHLPWAEHPWNASHQGAGVFAARVISGEATPRWRDRYFAWLENEADATTGFWRRGCIDHSRPESFFPHLAGTFHYLFNHEHSRRPLRHPRALIDSSLAIVQNGVRPTLGRRMGFAELDWIYCLTRAVRQSGHRFGEVQSALRTFCAGYARFLLERINAPAPFCDDLHALLGVISALAELQAALPGFLKTDIPLRLVLDRRPFI